MDFEISSHVGKIIREKPYLWPLITCILNKQDGKFIDLHCRISDTVI